MHYFHIVTDLSIVNAMIVVLTMFSDNLWDIIIVTNVRDSMLRENKVMERFNSIHKLKETVDP